MSADSLAKEAVLGLRVFRDPVDFLEQLELMDPRSVDDYQTTQIISPLHNLVYVYGSECLEAFYCYWCYKSLGFSP